ncbi:MAG: sugar transferase [Eubacterium sp.]|nr:sugar transferase [Eubacterium sp.]
MYRRRAKGWMKHADFILIDIIIFQISFALSCILRHGLVNPYSSILYRNTAILAVLVQLVVFIVTNTFENVLKRGYFEELRSVLNATFFVMLFLLFYLFSVQMGGVFSRFVLIACAGLYMILSYTVRSVMKAVLTGKVAEMEARTSIVAVATKKEVGRIVEQLQGSISRGQQISGVILCDEEEQEVDDILGVPVVARREDAKEYLCHNWVDEVYIELVDYEELRRDLIDTSIEMGITVQYVIGNRDIYVGRKTYLQRVGEVSVITITQRTQTTKAAITKRMLDIVGSVLGVIITGLLTLVIGPMIYIASPGPIFFTQKRIGRNGKVFHVYKFRSMYMDAEERKQELMSRNEVEDGMMFKIENDPRIIGSEKGPGKGIGNFIRRTSLDEFPQFWNVLKGDMSLVGTRPPTEDEWEKYSYHHRSRMSMKPGITGLWQVSGRSDIQDFEEVVKLDMEYIDRCCFSFDLKILLKTIRVVFGGKGAK